MFARKDENTVRANVTRVTLFAGRIRWIQRALGRNPLVRSTDRLEALAILCVLFSALFALPFAMAAETMVYESGARTAVEQSQSRHSVQALVVEGAGLPTDFDTPAYVRAQWHEGTRLRNEWVVSPATIRTGDQMTIWVNDGGNIVAAPLTNGDARLNATVAAVAVWITIVAISALAAFFARRALDRARDRGWERELNLLAHNDDGWANRRL